MYVSDDILCSVSSDPILSVCGRRSRPYSAKLLTTRWQEEDCVAVGISEALSHVTGKGQNKHVEQSSKQGREHME